MISLSNIGKSYQGKWIFKSVNFEFKFPGVYAITGKNGAGKSSLLKLISGLSLQNEGEILYKETLTNSLNEHISIASPYLELIQDFTVLEIFDFHFKFKKVLNNNSIKSILKEIDLDIHAYKYYKNLSSGMKQKLKLALVFYSDNQILLLDEPCSNLDTETIEWYQSKIKELKNNRLIIICSNDKQDELVDIQGLLNIHDFK